MNSTDLQSIEMQRPCPRCRVFVGECLVPHGDGALVLCWLCAHMLVDHAGAEGACLCTREQIYPAAVLQARRERAPHAESAEGVQADPDRVDRVVLVGQDVGLVGLEAGQDPLRTRRGLRRAARRLR